MVRVPPRRRRDGRVGSVSPRWGTVDGLSLGERRQVWPWGGVSKSAVAHRCLSGDA